jgi:GTPase KRas protein
MVRVKRVNPVFVLVGNKCDKTYEREVSREEGAALARQFGCEFLETSAKTAANVDRLFTDLIRSLRYQKELQENGHATHAPGNGLPHPPPPRPRRNRCVIV